MDISQVLPLLGGDEKTAALLKAANGDRNALLASMAGNNPDAVKILGLMSALEKERPQAKKSEGLKAISDFAPNDIIGGLYKLLR